MRNLHKTINKKKIVSPLSTQIAVFEMYKQHLYKPDTC